MIIFTIARTACQEKNYLKLRANVGGSKKEVKFIIAAAAE